MTTTNELTATPRRDPAPAGSNAGNGLGLKLAAIGGMLGALAASSCCVLPLVLFSVGVSGAWIGNLTALAPYQPIFVAFTTAVLGVGFYRVYRARRACAEGDACARALPSRFVTAGLWLATVLIGVALAFPYLVSLFVAV